MKNALFIFSALALSFVAFLLWASFDVPNTEYVQSTGGAVPQVLEDEAISSEAEAYTIEATLPNESRPHARDIRTYAQREIDIFAQQATEELAIYRSETPEYDWIPHILGIGYTAHTASGYTWYVLSQYYYTGGANGTQIVKVFGYNSSGSTVSLRDIITPGEEAPVLALVQEALYTFVGVSPTDTGVFGSAIRDLTLDALTDFYLTDTEAVFLFSEYDVAPGAFGAVEIAIPRSDMFAL